MKHLVATHNELVEKFEKLDCKDYAKVNEFDSKIEGIKIITAMNVHYKQLKDENKSTVTRVNRKGQVLEMLQSDIYTITNISKTLGITHRNVSSVICYLKKDGHNITTSRIGGETYITLTIEGDE